MIETKKLQYPFYYEEKTIIPGTDQVWELFVKIRDRYDESVLAIRELQKVVEEQNIEIDKLKRHVSNRVQKIEIVKFLGEESVPQPKHVMKDLKWVRQDESQKTDKEIGSEGTK